MDFKHCQIASIRVLFLKLTLVPCSLHLSNISGNRKPHVDSLISLHTYTGMKGRKMQNFYSGRMTFNLNQNPGLKKPTGTKKSFAILQKD